MSRRTFLCGLAALPALSATSATATAPAVAASVAADPFTGYHQEIVNLQARLLLTPEDTAEDVALRARWAEIDDLAMAGRPTTLAGAIGALGYARRELHQFRIENQEDPCSVDVLVLHLIDGALGVLRQARST